MKSIFLFMITLYSINLIGQKTNYLKGTAMLSGNVAYKMSSEMLKALTSHEFLFDDDDALYQLGIYNEMDDYRGSMIGVQFAFAEDVDGVKNWLNCIEIYQVHYFPIMDKFFRYRPEGKYIYNDIEFSYELNGSRAHKIVGHESIEGNHILKDANVGKFHNRIYKKLDFFNPDIYFAFFALDQIKDMSIWCSEIILSGAEIKVGKLLSVLDDYEEDKSFFTIKMEGAIDFSGVTAKVTETPYTVTHFAEACPPEWKTKSILLIEAMDIPNTNITALLEVGMKTYANLTNSDRYVAWDSIAE